MIKNIDKIIKYSRYLTALTLSLLVGLILYDATARYLFSAGSTALQELEWHFFDVVILLSIAYTLKEDAHVRVDIFYANFSPKVKLIIDTIATLFFILPLAGLIVYIGVHFTALSFLQGEASSDPGGLGSRWIIKAFMPLSFLLVVAVSISNLSKTLERWRAL